MDMTIQLWDTDDNNLIGTYSSEQAALRIVREGVQTYGAEAFQTVVLGGESSSGRLHAIAGAPNSSGSRLPESPIDRLSPA